MWLLPSNALGIVKRLILIYTLLSGFLFPSPVQAAALDTVIKLVVGAGSVFGFAQSAEAYNIHNQKEDIVAELKKRGLDPRDGAIFQIVFQVDPNVSDRWFFSPNVYALVQIAGQGDFIPASITKGYKGQKLLITFYGHQIQPGAKVLIHILDDKEFFNSSWKAIMESVESQIDFKINGAAITPLVSAQMEAGGQIQIHAPKDITLQPPGYLATADLQAPNSGDGVWLADGKLFDRNKHEAGVLQFGQIWRADPALLSVLSTSTWRIVFWGGIAIVFGAVFVQQMRANKNPKQVLNQSPTPPVAG